MRKFRKSLDNGTSNGGDHGEDLSSSAVNSPRAPRKSKGPSLPDGLNDGDHQHGVLPPGSPATNRRRRSRNPNEETDGTLMDFLQQSNKDRLSVGEFINLHRVTHDLTLKCS